jgi:hypothetical protein
VNRDDRTFRRFLMVRRTSPESGLVFGVEAARCLDAFQFARRRRLPTGVGCANATSTLPSDSTAARGYAAASG